MKTFNLFLLGLLFIFGCANGQETAHDKAFATLPALKTRRKGSHFCGRLLLELV